MPNRYSSIALLDAKKGNIDLVTPFATEWKQNENIYSSRPI